jgi:hypothetical protein
MKMRTVIKYKVRGRTKMNVMTVILQMKADSKREMREARQCCSKDME